MRMLRRAAVVLLMAATGIAFTTSAQAQSRQDGFRARQPLPKQPTESITIPQDTTGRVYVKFVDAVQMRALPDGTVAAFGGADPDEMAIIQDVVTGLGVRFRRGINHSDSMLARLEAKAAAMSGRAQPDLAGITYLEGPIKRLLTAARILNDLDAVEYVQFERERYLGNGDGVPRGTAGANDPFPSAPARPAEPSQPDGGGGGDEGGGGSGSGGNTGACCVISSGSIFCDEVTAVECVVSLQGQFQGLGTTCATTDCTGRCCLISGVCLDNADPNTCTAAGGFFQGPALACADFPCPVTGACCRGIICEVTDLASCNTDQGSGPGEFFPGESCDDISCRGACCLPDTSCIELTSEGNCTFTQGGIWGGPNTTCADVDCGEVPSPPGACCLTDNNCLEDLTDLECEDDQGGIFQGPGTECADVMCENMCGEPASGDCFMLPASPPGVCFGITPFCDDEDCCNLICNIDPFCCDDELGCWDLLCALEANLACDGGDRCISPLNESCFEPHANGGCNNTDCCEMVCMAAPNCCDAAWDAGCVVQAFDICVAAPDPDGPSPDYEPLQGYRTQAGYGGMIPAELVPYVPMAGGGTLLGYGGEGFNLGDPDQPEGADPMDPDYPGLYGFGQQLFDEYGIDATGQGNLTTGKTIKVAVIEWAIWKDHEDLDVIVEPGQTLITIPFVTEPDHATACMSIINAKNDGTGVTGIAPDAQGYFFPITSVEEGPRELSAWTSAINTLGPGDVISASYGPGPPLGNLNNDATMWPLIRLAADLGITVCVAAGNDCWNLDNSPDLGDSGGMVIGACSPGAPFYRLAFSNYCTGATNDRSNIVHLKAWGELVAAAGYRVLPSPGNPVPENRSYTSLFNGTSAATPQIAGICADLQGLCKQFYGLPLLPEQIRGTMGAPGSPPNPPTRLFGGFPQGTATCTLDLNPDEGPHMIGPFPDVAGTSNSAATNILTQTPFGFDGAPFLDGYAIATGTPIFGNIFSLRAADDNYLVFDSGQANAGDHPSPVGATSIPIGILNDITYIMTAQIADLVVESHLPPEQQVNGLEVNWELQHPGNNAFLIIEMYHFGARRWIFSDFVTLDTLGVPGEDVGGTSGFARVQGFVNENGVNFTRLWVIGAGPQAFGSEPTPGGIPFVMRWDLVDVRIGNGFGQFFEP